MPIPSPTKWNEILSQFDKISGIEAAKNLLRHTLLFLYEREKIDDSSHGVSHFALAYSEITEIWKKLIFKLEKNFLRASLPENEQWLFDDLVVALNRYLNSIKTYFIQKKSVW